jgi:hypothetical protein
MAFVHCLSPGILGLASLWRARLYFVVCNARDNAKKIDREVSASEDS